MLALLPESVVRELRVVPVAAAGETLTVATTDPHNIALADRLSLLTARRVRLVQASREEIDAFIDRHYGRPGSETESVDSLMQDFDLDSRWPLLREGFAASASAPPARSRARRSGRAGRNAGPTAAPRAAAPRTDQTAGLDSTQPVGGPGMFTYVVEEGQRVLMRRPNGTMEVIVGPRRVWRGRNTFQPMPHFVAHPGEFLIVRFRDGRQEHLPGPAEVWFDPRVHQAVDRRGGAAARRQGGGRRLQPQGGHERRAAADRLRPDAVRAPARRVAAHVRLARLRRRLAGRPEGRQAGWSSRSSG